MGYFQKTKSLSQGQNELIAKKTADIYGIICPEYYLYIFNPKEDYTKCIVYSRDINDLGEFHIPEVPLNLETLYQIWDGLEYKNFDAKALMPEIVKMYIFDLILGNYDRAPVNWGFITVDGKMHVVIYDNEHILSEDFTPYITCDLDEWRFASCHDIEDVFKSKISELQSFLEVSDETFGNLVGDFLRKITPKVFESILEEVAKETKTYIRDKESKMKIYKNNYDTFLKIYLQHQKKGR